MHRKDRLSLSDKPLRGLYFLYIIGYIILFFVFGFFLCFDFFFFCRETFSVFFFFGEGVVTKFFGLRSAIFSFFFATSLFLFFDEHSYNQWVY